mmetsp:Transcript_5983/g.16832  ORF Transcript_5983/g.16832 Transcript_5983/m.16832 type:complete len:255 (+) Transcript_5983:664-1428(+)
MYGCHPMVLMESAAWCQSRPFVTERKRVYRAIHRDPQYKVRLVTSGSFSQSSRSALLFPTRLLEMWSAAIVQKKTPKHHWMSSSRMHAQHSGARHTSTDRTIILSSEKWCITRITRPRRINLNTRMTRTASMPAPNSPLESLHLPFNTMDHCTISSMIPHPTITMSKQFQPLSFPLRNLRPKAPNRRASSTTKKTLKHRFTKCHVKSQDGCGSRTRRFAWIPMVSTFARMTAADSSSNLVLSTSRWMQFFSVLW